MKHLLLSLLTISLFISCTSDDDNGPSLTPAGDYENGILVLNEGPFGNGSGSITYISSDYATVEQNVFRTVNGTELGNVVQSMEFQGDDAYIVVNNSQKIVVANRYTFNAVDSITTGLVNPRYFVAHNATKGYVSNWGDPNDESDDFIAIVDLRTKEVTTTIPVPFGPERMLLHDSKLYVAHQGGYGQNDKISVIVNNSISKTITVGDVPTSLSVSGNYLYVLCQGKPSYSGVETAGSIVKIDLATEEIVKTIYFETDEHPSAMTIDANHLYYQLDGHVYKSQLANLAVSSTSIFDGFFYSLQAKDGKLYATDAKDYNSNGSLTIFDLSSQQLIQEFQTGIIPGGVYFN